MTDGLTDRRSDGQTPWHIVGCLEFFTETLKYDGVWTREFGPLTLRWLSQQLRDVSRRHFDARGHTPLSGRFS